MLNLSVDEHFNMRTWNKCQGQCDMSERSIQECVLWVSTLARSSEDECERFLKTASDWIGAFMGPNVCVQRFSRVHVRSKDRTCAVRGSLAFRLFASRSFKGPNVCVQRFSRVRPLSPHARSRARKTSGTQRPRPRKFNLNLNRILFTPAHSTVL